MSRYNLACGEVCQKSQLTFVEYYVLSLACCSSWSHKESDTAQQLNNKCIRHLHMSYFHQIIEISKKKKKNLGGLPILYDQFHTLWKLQWDPAFSLLLPQKVKCIIVEREKYICIFMDKVKQFTKRSNKRYNGIMYVYISQ